MLVQIAQCCLLTTFCKLSKYTIRINSEYIQTSRRTQNQQVLKSRFKHNKQIILQMAATPCHPGGFSKYNPLQMSCKIKARFVIDPKYLCKQPLKMNQFIASDVVVCDSARYDEEIVEERSNSDYNPLQYMMISQQ
ncbi:Hypothetical_protein [Hexamita inflata]|uniref:Hypothetical_protein n=1 Tax=Hexamita inflata TaxID=28002 RepID=A0AA86UZP9_9EUKA|nr:Hypothetical protein HINF_LOCUS62459 [Hexamita inflata]